MSLARIDAAQQPYRSVCVLEVESEGQRRYQATGWFAGPRTVITAAHCLVSAELGGAARVARVMPGHNGAARPYLAVGHEFRQARAYVPGAPAHDYGAILLDEPLGDQVGVLPLWVASDDELRDAALVLSGYPMRFAIPGLDEHLRWAAQCMGTGRVSRVTAEWLYHNVQPIDEIDGLNGLSGAPLWLGAAPDPAAAAGVPPRVVGLHAADGPNLGVRITQAVADEIAGWLV